MIGIQIEDSNLKFIQNGSKLFEWHLFSEKEVEERPEGKIKINLNDRFFYVDRYDVKDTAWKFNVECMPEGDEKISEIDQPLFDLFCSQVQSNRAKILELVQKKEISLKNLSYPYTLDKEIVIASLRATPTDLRVDSRFFRDKDIFLELLKTGRYDGFVPEIFCDDKEVMLQVLNKTPQLFRWASDRLKSDREIMKLAVQIPFDWYRNSLLKFGAEAICDDEEIVMLAVSTDPTALLHASDRLKCDKDIVKAAFSSKWIQKDSSKVFLSLPEALRKDPEIVELALKSAGSLLQHLEPAFKDDLELVKKAILSSHGSAFQFASDRLKEDIEIIQLALELSPHNLKFIKKEILIANQSLVDLLIAKDPAIFKDLPEELKWEKKYLLIGAEKHPTLLKDPKARKYYIDVEFMKNACRIMPSIILDAPPEIKTNHDVLLSAVESGNEDFLDSLDPSLLSDEEFLKRAIPKAKLAPALIKLAYQEKLNKERKDPLALGIEAFIAFANEKINQSVSAFIELNFDDKDLKEALVSKIFQFKDTTLRLLILQKMASFVKDRGVSMLRFIDAQKERSFHQGRIIPLILLLSIGLDAESEEAIFKKIYESKEFKDGKILKTLLEFMLEVGDSATLDSKAKADLLMRCLSVKDKAEKLSLLSLAIMLLPRKSDLLRGDFDLNSLIDHLVKDVRAGLAFDTAKFKKVFIEESKRRSVAILDYMIQFQFTSEMHPAIAEFIRSVLEGSFVDDRNKRNPYLNIMTPSQVTAWQETLSDKVSVSSSHDSVNLQEYLNRKLADGHLEGLCRSDLFTASYSDLSEIEAAIKTLGLSKNTQDLILIIDSLDAKISEGFPLFKQDLADLKRLILEPKIANGNVEELKDWEDLLHCGEDVMGSCQRISQGDSFFNRALMGYCLNGDISMLAIKDNIGHIKARCMMKIMEKEGKPVLLLEPVYPHNGAGLRANFVEMARKKASAMGVELYESTSSSTEMLKSRKGHAPYVYEDSFYSGRPLGVMVKL
jgi:hypothetical protein